VDAGPLPAAAERRRQREGVVLTGPFTGLLDELADGVRVLGWAEGIHVRAQYLRARNAVVRHLVAQHGLRVVAAETHFALSRPVDAHVRGLGPAEPSAAVVRGVWSWWTGAALRDNLALLTWLRRYNTGRAPADQVRFYGLEMYGAAPGDDAAPGPGAEPADVRHAALLRRRLAAHRAAGGDHRDLAVRDAAQYLTFQEVARRHPYGPILVFEQTEHLDRRVPGSLGEHLARQEYGPFRAVGAVWREGDPAVRYPLGRYRELSRHLARAAVEHSPGLLPGPAGTAALDLRPYRTAHRGPAAQAPAPAPALADAATAFDAALYAPALSPAPTLADAPDPPDAPAAP
jgi:hypothetical protein